MEFAISDIYCNACRSPIPVKLLPLVRLAFLYEALNIKSKSSSIAIGLRVSAISCNNSFDSARQGPAINLNLFFTYNPLIIMLLNLFHYLIILLFL